MLLRMGTDKDEKSILHILGVCSNEFVPPLSMRSSVFDPKVGEDTSVIDYYKEIQNQHMLLLEVGGEIVGLISFSEQVSPSRDLEVNCSENIYYISTSLILPKYRGAGWGYYLNGAMVELSREMGKSLLRRTWSTNQRQIRLLESLGFVPVKRMPRINHIESVYYFLKNVRVYETNLVRCLS